MCSKNCVTACVPQEELTINVTRLEIIEKGVGRLFVDHNVQGVSLSLQDDGRTLKVFINYIEPRDDK